MNTAPQDAGDTACMTLGEAWALLEAQETLEYREAVESVEEDLRLIAAGAVTVH